MKKVMIISSYVLALFLLLFGGVLIGGSCRYTSIAGPMNIDYSGIFSLFGLVITPIAFFLVRKLIEKYKSLFGAIIILYAFGLLKLFKQKKVFPKMGYICVEK